MDAFDSIREFPVETAAAALIHQGQVRILGDPNHVFEVASITKPVTAYGFLMAIEEGVMDFDTPAGPEGATVRHLLAHASGVGFDNRQAERGVEERRIYSSAGFEIVAELIEDETGMSFSEYMKLGIFEPLGMNFTYLPGSAGHSLNASVDNLVRFIREVQNPTLLHPSTVEDMITVQYPDLRGLVPGYGMQKPCPWGLGFEIHGDKDPHWMGTRLPSNTVGHFGMYGSYFWIAPDDDAALVVLSDRQFGEWAKPLWAETNDAIWSMVND